MRHRKGNAKLNKPTDQRIAMLRNLVISLIENGKIETTEARAKEARKMAEKVISLGKKGSLASIRNALKIIPNKIAVKKVFNEIAGNYTERNGGYTRIIKTKIRRGDAAQMAMLELVND